MKVLKEGKPKWTTKVKCKGCHAELEAEKEDITYRITDEEALVQHYKIDVVGTFFVTCPLCGQQLRVKNIPPAIQAEIMGE